MASRPLSVHPALDASSRLPRLARHGAAPVVETAILLGLGATAAAATTYLDLHLRIPGHAILRSVVPTALALALVPRRGAGTVTALGALGALLAFGGFPGAGAGAVTSLLATGPCLDAAAHRARGGRGVYVGLVAGGVLANLIAFGTRLWAKLAFVDAGRPLAAWWPQAIVTYTLCGAAAGLVGAGLWFRFAAGAGDRGGSARRPR